MDSNLIGAIATIFGAIIVWFIDRNFVFDKPPGYHSINKAIRKAVGGKWGGVFTQSLNNQSITVPIEFLLEVSPKGKIKGKIFFSYDSEEYNINARGGFYLNDFLKLEYENSNQEKKQFGSFVFEKSPDSKELEGCFVGYGYRGRRVISGPVKLHKTQN